LKKIFMIAGALIASLTAAHADTYVFSFSATNVISALSSAGFTTTNAYYALFLQPACADLASPTCTFASLSLQDNAWVDGTQTNLGANWVANGGDQFTYAQFSRNYAVNTATVVSSNNSMLGVAHADLAGNNPPVSWGTLNTTINAIMPGADTFTIAMYIPGTSTLTDSLTFTGFASYLAPDGSGGGKDHPQGATFSLTLVGNEVAPEPGTIFLMVAGLGALILVAKRKNLLARGASQN
jgi:PEP-CTERM motif